MNIQQKYRQVNNLIFKTTHSEKPLKWVYIYGLHRSGTTYMLNSFLKISKQGIGDWMMNEFAVAFQNAESRKRQTLDMDKLYYSLRLNLLENAPVGAGNTYDFVVKQATGDATEFNFWKRLFKAEPALILFLYREPTGWWSSAKEKFGYDENKAIDTYASGLKSFDKLGGIPLEYGEELSNFLNKSPDFKSVDITPFVISRSEYCQTPKELLPIFNEFKSKVLVY